MNYSAVIFDLDGTVLEDEDEYGLAFSKVLKKLGVVVKSEYPHVGGIGVKENWPIFLKKYKIKTDKSIEQLTKETQDIYLSMLDRVDFKDGFVEFIQSLRESGIATALATSNDWFIVEEILEKKNMDKYFDVITTGEEAKYKKPAPDLFLETARKLGLEPNQCVVIEDSKAGIDAAHHAGMKAIGIARNDEHRNELSDADAIIDNFRNVTI